MQDIGTPDGRDSAAVSGEPTAVHRFAGLVLDLAACTLARETGETIALTRGEFALLRVFVARRGRVLSRDALLDAVADRRREPFDRSIDVRIGRLRRKIEADPGAPRVIVTVPGQGYRFDGLRQSGPPGRPSSGLPDGAGPPKPNDDTPPRLSIVVLPFANIGGDPGHDHRCDGVTDSLTTELARMRNAFVIARSTAFTFKGRPVDVTALRRELNVRYALQGSVQSGADRLRVNVQLIDTERGAHLWADRFDKPAGDVLDMQDEIVARIASCLRVELVGAEARRSERTQDRDVIDLVFRGMAKLHEGIARNGLLEARALFEAALERDPDDVGALTGLANAEFLLAAYLYDNPAARLAAAESAALRAVSLAPHNAFTHLAVGMVLGVTGRPEDGIAECERALAINPNLALAHASIGGFKQFLGLPEETEAHVQRALRLSPRDPGACAWRMMVGFAKVALDELDEAARWFRASLEDSRSNPLSHFGLAAALALAGRREAARSALRDGLLLDPSFTVARFRAGRRSDHPRSVAARARIVDGLRLSGLPEA